MASSLVGLVHVRLLSVLDETEAAASTSGHAPRLTLHNLCMIAFRTQIG